MVNLRSTRGDRSINYMAIDLVRGIGMTASELLKLWPKDVLAGLASGDIEYFELSILDTSAWFDHAMAAKVTAILRDWEYAEMGDTALSALVGDNSILGEIDDELHSVNSLVR